MELFFLLLTLGIASIAGITIIGAIASRKYKFDFIGISVVSLFVYIIISATAATLIDTTAAVTLTGLLGLFEATIAWKWIRQFDAYFDETNEDIRKVIEERTDPSPIVALVIAMAYMLLGWIVTFFV